MLWLHVGDHHVAEELTQDTLVKICQHWPRVRRMDNVDGWVTTTALNMARSWWRRRYAERRTKRRAAAGPLGIEPSDAAGAIALRNAVAALPRRQREAIILRYWADLSVDATAQTMGCAAGTVLAAYRLSISRVRHPASRIRSPSFPPLASQL